MGNAKVELDLFEYATKSDLEGATGIDTSKLASKTDLATLKSKVNKVDVDKLIIVPVDLSKLSNFLENNAITKTVYDKLVTKVNSIENAKYYWISP